MKRSLVLLALLVLAACGGGCLRAVEARVDAFGVAREVERVSATLSLWPGFEPLAVPLAIYDGQRTYLFRHPSPPEGFAPIADAEPAASAYEGRYPEVIANTSADFGGVTTATLMLDRVDPDRTLTDLAAIALHETFHVYQRNHHPSWQANEADLLLYPTDDGALLALRRLETAALRRALAAEDGELSACWAGRALDLRRQRFAEMDDAFVAYERGTELNEGLATYVQVKAAGGGREAIAKASEERIPEGGYAAEQVRLRAYATGSALALLLDRLRPGWAAVLDSGDEQVLDEALAAALPGDREARADACSFTGAETAEAESVAGADVAALAVQRAELRARLDARPGWRVVVTAAPGEPLWPQGFDPLNVARVEGGLLHSRFVRLGNEAGQLEVLDTADADLDALTESEGAHPLFNGVRRVVIVGLSTLEVEQQGARVTVRAPGFTADFATASHQSSGTELRIQLQPTGSQVR